MAYALLALRKADGSELHISHCRSGDGVVVEVTQGRCTTEIVLDNETVRQFIEGLRHLVDGLAAVASEFGCHPDGSLLDREGR